MDTFVLFSILEEMHSASIGACSVGGLFTRGSGRHGFCLVPGYMELLPGLGSVGLVLGQRSTSESAVGSADSGTVNQVHSRQVWLPPCPWEGSCQVTRPAGARLRLRKTGIEIQDCFLVHNKNRGLQACLWGHG